MGALEAGEVQSQQLDINLVHPPGFEPNLSPSCVNSEETSIPPGFEGSNQLIASKNQGRSAVKRHIASFDKRVTRSQSKIIKNVVTRRMSTPKRRSSGPGGRKEAPLQMVQQTQQRVFVN